MLRHVPQKPEGFSHIAPEFHQGHELRDRLRKEIAELQAKLDALAGPSSQQGFASNQSYKEMIRSRQQMLINIARDQSVPSRFEKRSRL